MFIAAYVAGMAIQVGFRDASALSVEFIDGWGQLLVYFVFFLIGHCWVALAFCALQSCPRAVCHPQLDGGADDSGGGRRHWKGAFGDSYVPQVTSL